MIKPEEKIDIIKKHKTHETDTGSAEVQVALLSKEIELLLLHLKKHSKDFHSKKGLLKMVAQRRKFLKYIQQEDEKKYQELIKKIGLKK
ncbi:MAG: 30S ribosomal protein S15 [Candidatus Pacebacteria bacterium]|nr:30S ribosomal protein S15 [Candidatus Paceibacterota bacterium]